MINKRLPWLVFSLPLIVLLLYGTADSLTSSVAAQQQTVNVAMRDTFFEPKDITVPVGTTVVWSNQGQLPHTATSETGVFDSGSSQDRWLRPGQTFQFTFNQPGTFSYFCVVHRALGMAGTVTVTGDQEPTPTPTPAPQVTPTPTPTPVQPSAGVASQQQSITVNLGPGRDASQTGTAVLAARGNQTEVVVNIQPGAAGVPQPAHIHEGLCPNVGAVRFPLTNVIDGRSTTMVNAPLGDLLTGNLSINIHRSQQEAGVYVSCGNIPAAARLPVTGNAGLLDEQGRGVSWQPLAILAAGALLITGSTWAVARVRKSR